MILMKTSTSSWKIINGILINYHSLILLFLCNLKQVKNGGIDLGKIIEEITSMNMARPAVL
jgi:hypothetical protein